MSSQESSREKVLIASDHAGFALKEALKKQLSAWEWEDLGPSSADRVDYPDYAEKLARKLTEVSPEKRDGVGYAKLGVLICGSGIGVAIAANKIAGIRAATVTHPTAARLAREHNDANIVCIGARFLAEEYAAETVEAFLKEPFTDQNRHLKRVQKIMALD